MISVFKKLSITLAMSFLIAAAGFVVSPDNMQNKTSAADKSHQSLVISEIMYDAPGSDKGAEYIELSNVGKKKRDISDYYIGDKKIKSGLEKMMSFPNGSVIKPGESIILGQSAKVVKDRFDINADYEYPKDSKYNPDPDSHVPDLVDTEESDGYVALGNKGDDMVILMDRDQKPVDVVPFYTKGKTEFKGKKYNSAPCIRQLGHSLQRQYTTGDPSKDFVSDDPTPSKIDLKDEKPPGFPDYTSDDLLITEVEYDTYIQEWTGEFIEFTNTSDHPIDISGYTISDEETPGKGEGAAFFPDGIIVDPHQVVVVAENAKAMQNRYDTTPDFELQHSISKVPTLKPNKDRATGHIRLGNKGDQVLLFDQNMKLVDSISWGNAKYPPGVKPYADKVPRGHSIERVKSKDTNNIDKDFIEQPEPTPGKLLFGPNGDKSLIPKSDLKNNVLKAKEPDTGIVLPPTVSGVGGDSRNAPENTMAAIDKLLETKTPSILFPVQETKNGVLIPMKDETLNRTTNGKGRVDEKKWSDIKKLDAGSWFSSDFSGEKVPPLSEALDKIKGKLIPHIRVEDPKIADKAVKMLEEKGMTDAQVISSDPSVIKQVREKDKDVRGAILFEKQDLNEEDLEQIVRTTRRNEANVAIIPQKDLTKDNVHHLRKRGITVWGLGGDNSHKANRLITNGVGGILSENPQSVLQALSQYPENTVTQPPILWAHRGLDQKISGNTIPAFQAALDAGADVIEMDIHKTKDGHFVIRHSPAVDKTTDGSGEIRDMTLDKLKELNANHLHPDEKPIRIPTLNEALDWAKDKMKDHDFVLNLELKEIGDEKEIADRIAKRNMETNVMVLSFGRHALERMKNANQAIAIGQYRGPAHILNNVTNKQAEYAEKAVRDTVNRNQSFFSGLDDDWPELPKYAKHRGIMILGKAKDNEEYSKNAIKSGASTLFNGEISSVSNAPINLSSPSKIYMKKGESKKLNAKTEYRIKPKEKIHPFVKLTNPENDAIEIGNDSKTIKVQSGGRSYVQAYDSYTSVDQNWNLFSQPTEIEVITAGGIKAQVQHFEKEGEFANDDAIHALKMHLTTVGHFEKKNLSEKVIKHTKGFKSLLDHQKNNELIFEKAYKNLKADADDLIKAWQ